MKIINTKFKFENGYLIIFALHRSPNSIENDFINRLVDYVNELFLLHFFQVSANTAAS